MVRLRNEVFGVEFRNPLLIASGPGGFGLKLSKHLDLSKIGGFILKTVTPEPRQGNEPPRITDTFGGIINSIGLQNPGIDQFSEEILPRLEKLNTNIITSAGGESPEEFVRIVKRYDEFEFIKAIELNLSCPNVSGGLIGKNPETVAKILKLTRKESKKPLIAKLTPEVSDITQIATKAIENGADALTLINCPQGLKINTETGTPILKRKSGGLAGPAIKPIALSKIYKVRKKHPKTPIIGSGGIMNHKDVLDHAMAGANLTSIGTGIMINQKLPQEILPELKKYLNKKEIKNFREIISIAHKNGLKP